MTGTEEQTAEETLIHDLAQALMDIQAYMVDSYCVNGFIVREGRKPISIMLSALHEYDLWRGEVSRTILDGDEQ